MTRYFLGVLLILVLGVGTYLLLVLVESPDRRAANPPVIHAHPDEKAKEAVSVHHNGIRLPLDQPPEPPASPEENPLKAAPIPPESQPKAGSERLLLARELLDEFHVMQQDGSLDSLSVPRLEELQARISNALNARCVEIFDTRMALGLFESRRMLPPEPSYGEFEKEYGCKLGVQSGELEADGYFEVDIVLYPEAEYPEIYELDKCWQTLGRMAHEKRKNQ